MNLSACGQQSVRFGGPTSQPPDPLLASQAVFFQKARDNQSAQAGIATPSLSVPRHGRQITRWSMTSCRRTASGNVPQQGPPTWDRPARVGREATSAHCAPAQDGRRCTTHPLDDVRPKRATSRSVGAPIRDGPPGRSSSPLRRQRCGPRTSAADSRRLA